MRITPRHYYREAYSRERKLENDIVQNRAKYRRDMEKLATRISLAIDMLDPKDESSDAVTIERLRTCITDLSGLITMFKRVRSQYS